MVGSKVQGEVLAFERSQNTLLGPGGEGPSVGVKEGNLVDLVVGIKGDSCLVASLFL